MSSLSDLIVALIIPFGFIVAAGGCMMYNTFCKKSTPISRSHEVTIICDDPHVTINVVYVQPKPRVEKVKPIIDCSDPV
jgi:hypothetical protein